jgi:hypothetical protein
MTNPASIFGTNLLQHWDSASLQSVALPSWVCPECGGTQTRILDTRRDEIRLDSVANMHCLDCSRDYEIRHPDEWANRGMVVSKKHAGFSVPPSCVVVVSNHKADPLDPRSVQFLFRPGFRVGDTPIYQQEYAKHKLRSLTNATARAIKSWSWNS